MFCYINQLFQSSRSKVNTIGRKDENVLFNEFIQTIHWKFSGKNVANFLSHFCSMHFLEIIDRTKGILKANFIFGALRVSNDFQFLSMNHEIPIDKHIPI